MAAVNLELLADDLRQMEGAAAQIPVPGARYAEARQKMINY